MACALESASTSLVVPRIPSLVTAGATQCRIPRPLPLSSAFIAKLARSPSPLCRRPVAPALRAVAVASADKSRIKFQLGETSLVIPFSTEEAKKLEVSISALLQTFRDKEKATRPQRWQSMEYRCTGDNLYFEIFCNPNACANAFQAKALISLKTDRVQLTSEGALSDVKNSVDEFVMAHSA